MSVLHQPAEPRSGPLVSLKKLEHLLGRDRESLRRLAKHAGRYYRPFDRRRVRGDPRSKWRHIDNSTEEIKVVQRRIEKMILNPVPLPDTMMGAIGGRSIRDNAARHLAQPVVVALDLRACFPRTSSLKVFDAYLKHVRCSTQIASLLTQLTTLQGRLPQGAPTSATLANLTLLPLHAEIEALMDSLGLRFTFYIDDIVFSGPRAQLAVEKVIRAIQQHGHSVRRDKIHIMPASGLQRVTGVGVNRKLSALPHRCQGIRRRIYELASRESPYDYELRSVRGSIESVAWLSPLQGLTLKRLAERWLPDVGIDGPRPRTDETRPCNNPRRHRWAVTRPQRQADHGDRPEQLFVSPVAVLGQ